MGTRLSAAASAAIFLTGVFCTVAIAAEPHRLATSKTLGIQIDAMGGTKWCQQQLSLTVTAQNASVYPTDDFTDLIKKLGQVLETECPAARHADITGLDASKELVYEGNAASSNGWVVSQSSDTASPSGGTDWIVRLSSWLNTILGWASALRP